MLKINYVILNYTWCKIFLQSFDKTIKQKIIVCT